MDGSDFDALTRSLTASLSRRVTLGGLAAGALLALGLALDETAVRAKKKGKGKKGKGKGKKKAKPCPAGKVFCGGACRECCANAHCQGNPQLGPLFICENHRCIDCNSDDDCDLYGGTKPRCDAGRGRCVECLTSDDCPPDRPGCTAGGCVQHCGNGVLDGDESDVDCGGRCPGKCLNGLGCFSPLDCQSAICVGGTCRECEVDLDCPGNRPYCSAQRECVQCTQDQDCPPTGFYVCVGRECVQHCASGRLDGDESDVDCGGSCTRKCANGKGCFDHPDCESGFCGNGTCADGQVCRANESGDVLCGGGTVCACRALGSGFCSQPQEPGCRCICCPESFCADGGPAFNCGGECCCGTCNTFDWTVCEPR